MASRPNATALRRALKIALLLAMPPLAAAQAPATTGQRTRLDTSIRDVSLHARAVKALSSDHLNDTIEFQIALKMRSFGELLARTGSNERIESKEMTAKYLPTKAEYAAVRAWAESQGLKVTQTDDNRLALYVEGPVSRVQNALGVKFARVTTSEGEFTSATTAPSIPSSLADIVLGINGLQPHLHPRKFFMKRQATTGGVSPYMVSNLLSAYDASALGETGSGQTIAILIDTVPASSDLKAFWSANGIAQSLSNITEINVRDVTLPQPSGEETLDTEWTSGIAPAAKIRIYATGDLEFTSLDKGFQRIISDLATQKTIHALSISLGLGEEEISDSQLTTDSQYLATIAASGVSIFVSSGDDGSSPDGILQPSYYASDPSVTGVGGTSMVKGSEVETGWTDSGGGASEFFSRPAWQTGSGVIAGSTRLVPDVASLADPDTGAYIFLGGQAETVGGTSWGAPTWAGLSALINQARVAAGEKVLGEINASVYPLNETGAFRDITSGDNGRYSCATGFDLVTGLGSPKGAALLQDLLATDAALAPAITKFTPASGTAGTMVAISGTNLGTAASVQFNGADAIFTINSSTRITAKVPSGATTGPITVTTSGDETASSPSSFTVIASAGTGGLAVTGFSPTSGTAGTVVTVSGSAFSTATEVEFGGVRGNFSIVSATRISATVPSGAVSGPLTVASPSGSATSAASFTVLASSPGNQKVLFSTSFAAVHYSTASTLAGQNGWESSGYGDNGVVALNGGRQQAFLGYWQGFGSPDPTFVWHPVNYTPTTGAPIVTCSTSLTVTESTNGVSDDFGWAIFNSAGAFLFFIDFDNASGKVYYLLNGPNSNYVDTGRAFTDGTAYPLVVTMNYAANTWSATLGGKSLVSGKPITQTDQTLDFGDADAVWIQNDPSRAGNNYMLFGPYSITASP